MKAEKDFTDSRLLERIQPPVPPAFRRQAQDMIAGFAKAEGSGGIPRKRLATVLMIILLVSMLAGAAFAIARRMGVLDFLSPNDMPPALQSLVQTEFTRNGSRTDGISFRIRDALCDGRTLFVSVEAKTENPTDALLVTADDYYLAHTDMLAAQDIYGLFPGGKIDERAFLDAGVIRYMSPLFYVEAEVPGSGEDRFIPVIGLNWRYEGANTVVSTIMIDVHAVRDAEDVLQVTILAGADERVTEAEYREHYHVASEDLVPPLYIALGKAPLTSQIRAGRMEIRTARAEEAFSFAGYTYHSLEVSVSPLCTYVIIQKSPLDGQADDGRYVHTLLDAQGNAYEHLAFLNASLYLPNADGSWDNIPVQTIYRRMGDLPDTITLRASPPDGDDAGTAETLVVELTEIH